MTDVEIRTQPPGPKPRIFGGNALQYAADPIGFILRNRNRFGDVVKYTFLGEEVFGIPQIKWSA